MTKEILVLKEMLERAGIPFIISEIYGGYQINYPNLEGEICSVIQHNFSHGNCNNKIEIMGLLTESESINDDVAGWLSAQDVFNRIETHYKTNQK